MRSPEPAVRLLPYDHTYTPASASNRFEFRIRPESEQWIEHAAKLVDESASDFVCAAAERRADEVLRQHDTSTGSAGFPATEPTSTIGFEGTPSALPLDARHGRLYVAAVPDHPQVAGSNPASRHRPRLSIAD
ncbi:MAG TPA: DUF1778 domain-containing protein [Solirubrobacteraceae bacterium]|nr:DUF1778 domain-containing protein [Solirubrobacteraceae bacterium]